MDNMKHIAAFDFDGTLTRRDSLPAFIRFTCGTPRFLAGLLVCAPALLAYRRGLISNSRAKQRLFSHFFKGMPERQFAEAGRQFAANINRMVRPDTLQALRNHLSAGDEVIIVSASIKQWIAPWATSNGISSVLATEPEIVAGYLTGRFSTPNCHGTEKVTRLKAATPPRSTYHLTAYGDSHGDDALLAYADTSYRVSRHGIRKVINTASKQV